MNNKNDILFSIVIATYNRADIIKRSIDSIINQTYTNWELLIVDDGSTDNTKEVVKTFEDPRIIYFYKNNEERSIARNFGVEKASGKYVCFLDDDDYYLPAFLKTFYDEIIQKETFSRVFTCLEYTETNGIKSKNSFPKTLITNPVRLLWNIQTSIRPFLIHRDIIKKEKFKPDCKFGQDFHLAIRIALKHKVVIIQKYLSVNVVHDHQGTKSKFMYDYKKNAELSIMCIEDLLEKHKAQLSKAIPAKEINDLLNHKIYGFLSASMKHCDFKYFFHLIKKFKFKASVNKSILYGISLFVRLPVYYLKCIKDN